jgi:hypothetical protein
MFDQFWDLDKLVEDRVPGKVDIVVYDPLLRAFLGLGFM